MRALLNDKVTVVNGEGRVEDVSASVQREKIFVDDVSVLIEPGDTIERRLKNGRTEVLQVTNVHQYSGSGGIPDFYEIEYERQGAQARRAQPSTFNVNVLDSLQPHININSTDQSTNTVHSQPRLIFDEIRSLLREGVHDADELDRILLSVDDMESSSQIPHEFTRAYKDFISTSASHLTLLAPVLPSLASLLQ